VLIEQLRWDVESQVSGMLTHIVFLSTALHGFGKISRTGKNLVKIGPVYWGLLM